MGGSSKETTVGYWYGLTVHMGICYGPVDAVTEFQVDDRVAWSGSVTSSGTLGIFNPGLFGGEEREGGLVGSLDVCMGEATQGRNSRLVSALGSGIPAFRGILGLVWEGKLSANNPYLKAWAVKVRRIVKGWHNDSVWYAEKAAIGVDMNPAHIVYQCLTDPTWGMGYPSSSIDDTVFRSVADALYSEGFGLSMIWNQSGTIQGFVQIVMDHIGGVLRVDPTTGKFVIKLIRGDYSIPSLTVIDPSNATLDSFQRVAVGETTNEVTLVYTDPTTGKDTSITVQDLANIQAQGAVVNRKVNYPGIRSATIAARCAMRDLVSQSTPLAKVKLSVNRKAWSLLPGDVFVLNWPKLGISDSVYRVLAVGQGTLKSGTITVDACEDVFGLPASSYAAQEPVGWTDPGSLPAAAPARLLDEAAYWDLARNISAADLAYLDPTDCFLYAAAQKPSDDAFDFRLYSRPTGGTTTERDRGPHCPTALLNGAIGLTDTVLNYDNAVDVDEAIADGSRYIIIGSERLRLDSIDLIAKTITVKRGVLDTVPETHADNSRIWFSDGISASDPTAYVSGETVYAKVITATGRGVLDVDTAPEDSLVMAQRQARPYPPGKVRINAIDYPSEIVDVPSIPVTWAHRDRLQQTATIIDQDASSIGPEAGTTYSYRLLRADTSAVVESGSGISVTSATLSGAYRGDVILELWSVRSGLESWKRHRIPFSWLSSVMTTWSPTDKGSTVTLSGADLTATCQYADSVRATVGLTSGKRQFEVTLIATGSEALIGVGTSSADLNWYPGYDANGKAYYGNDGTKYTSNSGAAYGATFTTGDVIGCVVDFTAGTIRFYKNGVDQGSAFTFTPGTELFPMMGSGTTGPTNVIGTANFGNTAFAYPVSGAGAWA